MNTPKSTDRHQRLEKNITRKLDRSLECDPYELERLADIRARALAAIPAGQPRRSPPWAVVLTTAMASAVIAGVVLLPNLNPTNNSPSQQPALAELEWLVDDAELEMLETELEFYQWAAEEVEDPS